MIGLKAQFLTLSTFEDPVTQKLNFLFFYHLDVFNNQNNHHDHTC